MFYKRNNEGLVGLNSEKTTGRVTEMTCKTNRKVLILAVTIVITVVLAFVVGYLVRRAVQTPCTVNNSQEGRISLQEKEKTWKSILQNIKASNIDDNLKYLSAKPHVAGSQRNNELAAEIERRFKSYGFMTEKPQYNVLLSYPQKLKPNYAYIFNDKNQEKFRTQLIERSPIASENSPDAVQPFNAYSPAGTATGDLVYVNYGTTEDFRILKDHFKVNCTGKIVIVRYGRIFRGTKVSNAARNGAKGVLIYNDPINSAPAGADDVYPRNIWMPRDGVQRGSIGEGDGDMLTPGWPSVDGAYRLPINKAPGMPKIQCHPISANDAYQFLSKMAGQNVGFSNWTGGLNITYRVGPGFSSPMTAWKVKIEINNVRKQMQITNVIGTIRGSLEPDRYVIVGNHRDSWVFGGVDASSGGSVLLELSRVFGEKLKTGWRPSRSIKFCSWGGEESGLIGSSEYVEENLKVLTDRTVAYINLDTAVIGNYSMTLSASPILYQLLYKTLKMVQDPLKPSMTLYSKAAESAKIDANRTKPSIGRVPTSSDYAHFYHLAAIPVVDMIYKMGQLRRKYKGLSFYPVYHSLYDTYNWMKKFIDPKFLCHRSSAEFAGYLLLQLSDSPIVPFDPRDYSAALSKGFSDIKRILEANVPRSENVSTAYLDRTIKRFKLTAEELQSSLSKMESANDMALRMVNDQLVGLEKGFILPAGFPGRPVIRHIVFSPSSYNSYGSSAFPGVTDLLYEIKQGKKDWGSLKKHLTIIAATIDGVATSLKKLT